MEGKLIPADIVYGTPTVASQTHSQYATNLRKSLKQAYLLARNLMEVVAKRQKSLHDKRVYGEPYEVVWVLNPAVPRGVSRKTKCPWIGPFCVVKKLSDVTYCIQTTANRRKRQIVHFDRLKRCDSSTRTQQRSHLASNTVPVSAPAPIQNTVPPGTHLQKTEDNNTDPQVLD